MATFWPVLSPLSDRFLQCFPHSSLSLILFLWGEDPLKRITAQDPELRNDTDFHQLLKQAAGTAEMQAAQEAIFKKNYFEPAKKAAEELGLTDPLAIAIFTDTAVQGGLKTILNRTNEKWGEKDLSTATTKEKQDYLKLFLKEREGYLTGLSGKSTTSNADQENSKMLNNAANGRIGALKTLVGDEKANDLNLSGNQAGVIEFRGAEIPRLKPVAPPAPGLPPPHGIRC